MQRMVAGRWSVFLGAVLLATSCTAPSQDPCADGTIVLLDCLAVDGAAPDRFTDEACRSFHTAVTRAAPTQNDAQAPVVDAPTEAQSVAAGTPFQFRWHPTGLALRLLPARTLARRRLEPRDELRRWFTVIPEAHAHCAPFGGVAYELRLKSGAETLARVQTANTSYTPDAATWSRLRAARSAITMYVYVARFSGDAVTEGPYQQTLPRTFTIAP